MLLNLRKGINILLTQTSYFVKLKVMLFHFLISEMRIWKKLNRMMKKMKKGKKNWLMKIYGFSGFLFVYECW